MYTIVQKGQVSMTKPTESNVYPGYFHVQGFSHYVISSSGDMINTITGHHIASRKNNSGYYVFPSVRNDHGVKRQLSRARAMCLAFKPNAAANFLQVDHVNCIHDDDRISNLEWVTPKENCQLASKNGLYCGPKEVVVRNYATKKETIYPSMAAAARAFNMSIDAMQYRLEMNDGRVYPEGNQYQFKDKLTNWTEAEDLEFSIEKFGTCKRVLVRDLKTGEIHEFDKARDAAKFLQYSESFLSTYLSEGSQRVLKGFFVAKRRTDDTPWREVLDPLKEFIHENPQSVIIVIHKDSGRKFMYLSQIGCAKSMKLLPSTLNYRLKFGKPNEVYPDGYIYRYYSETEDGSTTSDLSRRLMTMSSSEMPFTRAYQIG